MNLAVPLQEILQSLCTRDPRHPDYAAYAAVRLELDDEPESAPCGGCDSCFYGQHRLADDLLKARAALGLPVSLEATHG